jgi:uncharacterized MAPEG superfamily protein
MLALSVVLGLIQIPLVAQARSRQNGSWRGAGPRDEPKPPFAGVGGRFERTLANYLETFPFFAAAVLITHAAGRHDWMTV